MHFNAVMVPVRARWPRKPRSVSDPPMESKASGKVIEAASPRVLSTAVGQGGKTRAQIIPATQAMTPKIRIRQAAFRTNQGLGLSGFGRGSGVRSSGDSKKKRRREEVNSCHIA